jgi:DNA-binding NarL/FixJ family response regulator
MVMTPMSGVDLVRAVRTAREDLPCVVCTAYTEDHVDVRGLAALGVATLLRKTMDVGEIVTAISRATKRART